MNPIIRMPRALYREARADLERPHAYAGERVGFLFGRHGATDRGPLLLPTTYEAVPDQHYVEDPCAGARIGGAAIRRAMQRVLETGECAIHIHLHDHAGPTWFSRLDERELARLMPSFGHVAPGVPCAALVFSLDQGAGVVWADTARAPMVARISVVGFPLSVWCPQ